MGEENKIRIQIDYVGKIQFIIKPIPCVFPLKPPTKYKLPFPSKMSPSCEKTSLRPKSNKKTVPSDKFLFCEMSFSVIKSWSPVGDNLAMNGGFGGN